MLRLLAMLFAFAVFAGVLVISLTTWTFGEITDVTSNQATYRHNNERTDCTAHIRYEVDGRVYRSRDTSFVDGHHGTEVCPFEVGQSAIVVYTDEHPEMGNAYTRTGNGIWALGFLLFGVPLFGWANAQRVRRGVGG